MAVPQPWQGVDMTRLVWKALAVAFVAAMLFGCARSPQQRRDRYVSRGRELVEKKDYTRALLEFKNAARVIPNDAGVYYEMGLAFLGARDFGSSYQAFSKALSLDPKHARAQLAIAQLEMQHIDLDRVKDAETRLKALLKTNSPTSEMLNALAFTELRLGNPQNAAGAIEQALAQAPQELFSIAMLARAKLSLNDIKGAQAVLEKAANDAPKSSAARSLLGEFFVRQNKPAEAEAAFRQALALDPDQGPALLALGLLESAQGRKQEAGQTLRKLSAIEGYKSSWALFLYQEGRRDEAIREFERLVKENPEDRQMRTNLVVAYRTTNHSAEADNLLEKALKKNGKDADARLQHAEISIERAQYAQAEIDLSQLLKLKPDAAEAHYVKARLNLVQGRTLICRQELSEVLRLNPELLAARMELAQNLLDAKEVSSALALMDAAPAYQRSALPLLVQRNWAFWTKDDMPEMRKGIDQGLAIARTSDLLVQDGFWKLRTGHPAQARSALEEALKLNPADLRALMGMRQSYLTEKNAPMALNKVKEFAAANPKSEPVQEFLGNMLMGAGMKVEARSAFEAAKAADPKSADPQLSLVQIDMLEGKLDSARQRLESLLSKDNRNNTARHWLADIDAMRGQSGTAIQHFREVVAVDSGNAEAYNNLAYLLIDQQPDEALKYAQRAVELVPDRPAYSDTLGWALYRKGMYAAAIQYLKRAAGEKGDAVWTYHLAMAYAKSGDLVSGRRTLQAALKQNPHVPEAKMAQAVIGQGN
jgi:tetratricopeptide (TPR) repeat protein